MDFVPLMSSWEEHDKAIGRRAMTVTPMGTSTFGHPFIVQEKDGRVWKLNSLVTIWALSSFPFYLSSYPYSTTLLRLLPSPRLRRRLLLRRESACLVFPPNPLNPPQLGYMYFLRKKNGEIAFFERTKRESSLFPALYTKAAADL